MPQKFPGIDFNAIRTALVRQVQSVTGLTTILSEPETQDERRPGVSGPPSLPYFSLKILQPGAKSGDDDKRYVSNTTWNSGGVRKMTVEFDCYGNSHEEAYNWMATWQTALDLEDVQMNLRMAGIAVWVIGDVADLSALLNTGYEGRAHLECTFGIAMNLQSDLGSIETVPIEGTVTNPDNDVDFTVDLP